MNLNRFQIQVATGRFTLPVVVIVCLLLWGISFREWNELASMAIIGFIGYVMIEANTAFTLIRTRTSLPVSIYGWIATALFFLHSFEWINLIPLIFILSVFQLFRSYESSSPTNPIYHTFLFIGLGSLIFPQIVYFVPLFWGSMIPFRAMSGRSFLASLLGVITPYWFLFGYAFVYDKMELFWKPIQEMTHFYPMAYNQLTLPELISWGIITILLIISSIHYGYAAYMDKTRTRIYHSFVAFAGLWATLFSFLQPMHLQELMPIQLICMAFLSGHLFSLTRNRFSGILFIVIFAAFILLMIFNLWMQYFNS